MSAEVATAVKNLKTIGAEITQWENRLEIVKIEVEKNTKARDTLQNEIDRKTSDFTIYISQRDAEVKKAWSEMMQERAQLTADKEQFQELLKGHRQSQSAFDVQKQDLDVSKLKNEASLQNVQDFITAVRRAAGLLGI